MDDVHAFLGALDAFFGHLAAVAWGALALAIALNLLRLVFRVRAWQNIVHAAYPGAPPRFASVFGAYMGGVGVNAVTPARGGDLVKLYLLRQRVAGSSYPTLASTLVVETLFDFVVASVLFVWAVEAGLLPGVPDLPHLPAFDWSFVVAHPRVTAVLASVALAAAILLAGWASRQVFAFRAKVARGFAVLGDWRFFLTRVVSWQALSWAARLASVYFFLRAFHIEPTVATALAVLVVQGLSTMLPFTPGGVGAQQAVLVFALQGTAAASAVLSFSVGMQLATVVANVAVGFAAIALMMRTLRWRSRVLAPEEGLVTRETARAPSRSAARG